MLPKYKKIIYYFILLVTFIYILFRIFFTMPYTFNFSFMFFGIIVLIVEVLDFISFAIHVFHVLTKDYLPPKVPRVSKKDYPELDVFIATINEDVELVEGTINACKNMKYPDKKKLHFYLCDDGHREEMKKLCRKTHIHYIDREDHKDAKAGNYNHALSVTHSPYIVVFDADMQPTPNFLEKTVPYLFYSDKVGFVQTPQNFRNYDLFQQRFKLGKTIPLEQEYFYHRIQISKNHNNSCIYCGTNAILSRKALEEVGGFATKSVTEDIATGLLMQRHGYLGISLPYDEAFGLNVEDFSSLLKQKTRWCRGCLQTFKNYKILKNSNLNFKQKMDYLSNLYYWFFGLRNFIYILIPLLYAFFGIRIIFNNTLWFLILFSIQYILKTFIFDLVEGKESSTTWNRIYEIILSPAILIDSIKTIIGYNDYIFDVAKKKKSNEKIFKYYFTICSHIILFILNILGFYITFERVIYLYELYNLISLFWITVNCIFLIYVLIFDFSNKVSSVNERKTIIKKYPFFSTFILIKKYIVEELTIKKFLQAACIFVLIALCFPIYNYFQYRSTFVIKKEDLVSYNGWLSIKDGNIVNNKGNEFQLKGISTHILALYGYYYTKEHIEELKDTWGMNVFRIAIYTDPETHGIVANKEQLKEVENLIDICIDLDIYAIVDWHILADNNPNTYKTEAIEFFDYISKKYKNYPNIIYELCNEPSGDITWDGDIKPYAEELTGIIRKNTNDSLIIVGVPVWSKDLKPAMNNPLEDKNSLYTIHYYAGDLTNDYILDDMIEAKKRNMAVFVTECGPTNETADGFLYNERFDEWIDFLNKNNNSWIIWSLSEKAEEASLVIQKEVQDRLDYLNGKYTEIQLKKKKYRVNDYLSSSGKLAKQEFLKSN